MSARRPVAAFQNRKNDPIKSHPFTRPTVAAAVELLASKLSQAKFDQVLVRLELDHKIPLGPGKSVTPKSALLAGAVMRRPA